MSGRKGRCRLDCRPCTPRSHNTTPDFTGRSMQPWAPTSPRPHSNGQGALERRACCRIPSSSKGIATAWHAAMSRAGRNVCPAQGTQSTVQHAAEQHNSHAAQGVQAAADALIARWMRRVSATLGGVMPLKISFATFSNSWTVLGAGRASMPSPARLVAPGRTLPARCGAEERR